VDGMTMAYLVVGGLSVVILLLAVVVGDVVHLALHADSDGPFSLPAIAAFFGGGGFGGAIAASLLPGSLPTAARLLISLAVAVAVAIPLAWAALRFASSLMHLRTDDTLTAGNILGAQGSVVTAITSASAFGEVRLRVGGHTLKYSARSEVPLPFGTPVYVTDVLSATSVKVVSTACEEPITPGPTSRPPDQH
jgi:membrane protein implicated in regulation of membrane protease activity